MTDEARGGRRPRLMSLLRAMGLFCTSRHLHGLVHFSWQLVKVALGLVFLLWTIGIPGLLLSRQLQPHVTPFHVEVSRITWSPPKGIIIHGMELFDLRYSTGAIARVDTCVIRPSYRRLLEGEFILRSVRWSDGSIIIPQAARTNEDERASTPMFVDVSGEVIPREEFTTMSVDAMSDIGSHYRIDGTVIHAVMIPDGDQQGYNWTHYLDHFLQSAHRTPAWITFMRDRVKQMQFAEPPRMEVGFVYDTSQSNQPSGQVTYNAPAFIYLGQPFDGISVVLTRSNGIVRIEEAQAKQGTNRLFATGAYSHDSGIFEAHLYNDLGTMAALPYLPEAWRKTAESWGLTVSGAMQAEAWIGPCHIDDVPRNWGGWAKISDAELNGFAIENAFASIKRSGDMLAVEDGRITGGRGVGHGVLEFTMTTDYSQRTSQGACSMTLEMKQLTNSLPRGLRHVARFFDIETRPVHFNGRYFTPLDDLDQLVVTGDINGTNGAFRSVQITGFNTTLLYSNNLVVLDPFAVTCPTGMVNGALRLDLRSQLYDIDLEITSNPRVVSPMGGTNLAHYFRHYHFTDDILVKVKGLIDARKDEKTALAVTMGGRGMGYGPFTFDRLTAQAMAIPGQVLISNMAGVIYAGTITGRLDLALGGKIDTFHADFSVTNISLDQMAAAVSSQPTNQYEGIISGNVDITGDIPERKGWPGLRGTGSIIIKDGRLLRIPVFGGLSKLLEKIYPGLGFSEQNLLEASLDFHDGAVHTDDLRLSGSVVSLSADGYYRWSDELNFHVKVHPFRDGSIASVLRIVTMPISFILELEMTGTLKNPSWKAANFPL